MPSCLLLLCFLSSTNNFDMPMSSLIMMTIGWEIGTIRKVSWAVASSSFIDRRFSVKNFHHHHHDYQTNEKKELPSQLELLKIAALKNWVQWQKGEQRDLTIGRMSRLSIQLATFLWIF